MLAKIKNKYIRPWSDPSDTEEKTYLVLKRWTDYQPHLEDEIDNVELLEEDGSVRYLYNLFNDQDWQGIWCSPNGKEYFSVRFIENEISSRDVP